ncbi:MAG: LysR family transcriptional regulator, partial [Myxococcales bacterium]|nr:LysR family transcriptional regulator [Myxococcales bacterium]
VQVQYSRCAMNLSQLRYFREVARLGSMSAATRVLKVSQPTLSVAMRQLEESLQSKLLLRHRGGVDLTAAGEELLRHAEEIFAMLDRAAAAVAGIEHELVGTYVLGCHESLGAYFLPRFLPGFLREAPQIALTLHNASSARVRQAVIDREVHFGLVVNPEPHPEFVMTPLFRDAVDFFVCARDAVATNPMEPGLVDTPGFYADERCATLDTAAAHERLRRGPLIFAGRVEQCAELLGLLAEQDVVPSRMLSCGDFELVKSLALAGVGVALLPRRIAAYNQPGQLRRLNGRLPMFPDEIMLLYRADQPRTRAAQFVKDALVRSASEMPSVGVG